MATNHNNGHIQRLVVAMEKKISVFSHHMSPWFLLLASAEGAVHVTDIIVVVSVMVAASRIIF
jgi:hypothetical protein